MKKLLLLSSAAPGRIVGALSERFDVLLLPPDPALHAPVASHPDMLVFSVGERVVMAREYLGAYPSVADRIAQTGVRLIPSDAPRGAEYPLDVSLNCLVAGKTVFCHRAAAPEAVDAAEAEGYRVVRVRQGYAACSALSAGGAVVTADPSVARAAEDAGLAVLRISPGGISLPGYDSGFIGGASGVFRGTVFFFGDPMTHPDGARIASFLEERGIRSVALSDGPLIDLGGMKTAAGGPFLPFVDIRE